MAEVLVGPMSDAVVVGPMSEAAVVGPMSEAAVVGPMSEAAVEPVDEEAEAMEVDDGTVVVVLAVGDTVPTTWTSAQFQNSSGNIPGASHSGWSEGLLPTIPPSPGQPAQAWGYL
jgi:hypothetical protein